MIMKRMLILCLIAVLKEVLNSKKDNIERARILSRMCKGDDFVSCFGELA